MTGKELKSAMMDMIMCTSFGSEIWQRMLEEEQAGLLNEALIVLEEVLPGTDETELYEALQGECQDYREEILQAYQQMQTETETENEWAEARAKFLLLCMTGLNCSTLINLSPSSSHRD